jgi:hypothetical protein
MRTRQHTDGMQIIIECLRGLGIFCCTYVLLVGSCG